MSCWQGGTRFGERVERYPAIGPGESEQGARGRRRLRGATRRRHKRKLYENGFANQGGWRRGDIRPVNPSLEPELKHEERPDPR
jgi:hypothetical protein